MEPKFKFKHSETFVLRNGWAQKALQEIERDPDGNVFSKAEGAIQLGVGSNMVPSIKYWLSSAGIICDKKGRKTTLTPFGSLIKSNDPFFESPFVWQLVHYKLISNIEDVPLFHILFEETRASYSFTRADFDQKASEFLEENYPSFKQNQKYIDDDSMVLIRSYIQSGGQDPEENYDSPLSQLGLLEYQGDGVYKKTPMSLEGFDERVAFIVLKDALGSSDHCEASDAFSLYAGPAAVFNLDFPSFMSILTSLNNQGFLTLSRTAGLNVVYINQDKKNYSVSDLFRDHYKGSL